MKKSVSVKAESVKSAAKSGAATTASGKSSIKASSAVASAAAKSGAKKGKNGVSKSESAPSSFWGAVKARFKSFIKTDAAIAAAIVVIVIALSLVMGGCGCGDSFAAMAIVAGVAGGKHVSGEPLSLDLTREASPDLLRNEIDDRIVKIRPMSTPVDQISRLAGSRKCGSMQVDYYSVDTKPVEAKLSSLDRSSTTSTQGFVSAVMQTDRDEIFEPSETIMVPDVTTVDGALVLYVVSKDRSGLTVIAANNKRSDGTYVVPAIESGSKLIRMGRAAAELDVQTAQFESLPVKANNLCQIFKAQVEQSTYQKIANKEVGWNFNDQEEAAIVDMRQGMEKNFLFGTKQRIYDPVKREHIMLTGGIWQQAGKESAYTVGSLDLDRLIEISRDAFTGNGGSSKKILIGGTKLVEQLNKLDHLKVVGVGETMTRWGLDFSEIVTKFGRLYVISSEIFDQCGHIYDGLIIDPEYLTKYCHVPFSTELLNLRESGVRNTDAIVITEASCLVLRYPQAHMRLIGQVPAPQPAPQEPDEEEEEA